jgi:hypothetical protein
VETLAGLWPLVLAFMGTGALLFALGVLLGVSLAERRTAPDAAEVNAHVAKVEAERDAARRELAEVRDLASQWKTQADALSGALVEVTADRDRLAHELKSALISSYAEQARLVRGCDAAIVETMEVAGSDLPPRDAGLPEPLSTRRLLEGDPTTVAEVESWPLVDGDDDPPASAGPSGTVAEPDAEPTPEPTSAGSGHRYSWAHLSGVPLTATIGVMPSDRLRGLHSTGQQAVAIVRERLLRPARIAWAARRRPRPRQGWDLAELDAITEAVTGAHAARSVPSPRLASGPGVHTRRRQRREALARAMQDTAAWTMPPLRSLRPGWREAVRPPGGRAVTA